MESIKPEASSKQDIQKEFNIMLLGETGSGKSTLINYLMNYFHNGTLDNLKIAIPTKHHVTTEDLKHHEDNVQDASKSKTRACAVYNFRKHDTIFNFIDTPGLSDTEGVVQDDFNIQQIMGAAEQSGLLTAIVLVINGTQTRATVTLRNTLCLMKRSIPDVLLQNLVVVLTNCSAASVNFDMAYLKPWTVHEVNVFYMNNSALSRPASQWMDSERKRKAVEKEWKCSMETIEELIQNLTQLGGKATEAFKQMRMKRDRIKSQLHSILLEVKKYQSLQNELDIMKITQKCISTDIQIYSEYKRTTQVEHTEFVQCDDYNTICSECSNACHENEENISPFQIILGIALNEFTVISMAFNLINIFLSLSEPLCHCEHPLHTHYNAKIRPIKKIITVEEVLEDMKSAYDLSVSKNEKIQSKIGSLDTDIAAVKYALDEKEADILKCCHELKKLCSQFNFVDELQGILGIMERYARMPTSTVARLDAEKRIRNIKLVVDTLSSAGTSD
nr:uncharacterized protein LOC109414094 [Aedes albopictus]XP_029733893.1 uncharacterized protein LOC109414094 [Aedes albopictus]XP_029733894.1 uncharacterized protein LOC109414094 [Aedes albopictus]XP_029733895.1 uncharacterized protein LOC109414094 [Aedes albopictus]